LQDFADEKKADVFRSHPDCNIRADALFSFPGWNITRGPGKQFFVSMTLKGDDSEIEVATGVGDVCRALSGRVFFSIVVLGENARAASEAIIQAVLLEYMCSFNNSGMASTSAEAAQLHLASYEEWTTGYTRSCAKAFPLRPSTFCAKEFVKELRGMKGVRSCTNGTKEEAFALDGCCNGPIHTV
jgi:hypothetical protein